ncbi:MAG: RNA-binding protein [Gammaproteobacteria bacterium]|nr:RNA-binding protein [Gammaproteobacteria bacterium]
MLIRNLDRLTAEQELKEFFEPFGAVQSCNLVVDRQSGASKGFAFVEHEWGARVYHRIQF